MQHGILAAAYARLAAELTRALPPLLPFVVDGETVGFLSPERAARLASFESLRVDDRGLRFAPAVVDVEARSSAMAKVARALADEGCLSAWRAERYAVRNRFDAAPCFYLERAAARYFGVRTYAVHANGYVVRGAGPALWFARRSPTKPIDPGIFDTLVGGGIPERDPVFDTLLRESWEEAGLCAALARAAQPAGSLDVVRCGNDGVQRETIFVYDLALPETFVPDNQDGEAVEHRLLACDQAAALIGTGETTLDCALIALDWLTRQPAFVLDATSRAALAAFCRAPREIEAA